MRLVIISETQGGQKINEGLVKTVTGGDLIRARRMREDHWQFKPSHTAVMVTNHQPVVRGTDNGIWRRLRLVPFEVTIPEADQDKQLPEKLAGEYPAILRWMVEGCLAWQREGLNSPARVIAATDKYKHDQAGADTFAEWFAERVKSEPSASEKASDVFADYVSWCETGGDRNHLTRRRFGERIGKCITAKRVSDGTWYDGIKLLPCEKQITSEPSEG